jgi:hypothetical protein
VRGVIVAALAGCSGGDAAAGPAGTRKAEAPPKPMYPGQVKRLPAGQKVYTYGATCMATQDGGVACMGGGDAPQGFPVTSTNTTTFGSR